MPSCCVNNPDVFCYICGELTFTVQRRNLTPLSKSAMNFTLDVTLVTKIRLRRLIIVVKLVLGLLQGGLKNNISPPKLRNLTSSGTLGTYEVGQKEFKWNWDKCGTSQHELDEALSHLDPTKAPGPGKITGPMLNNLSSNAKLKLLSIFNYSWSSSTLPKEWKHASIIPILKPGMPEDHPTNYRPISLTSIPCKIMEHMILKRLNFYLNLNNLLDPHQRAF
ncbi:hypothetical protein LAZ67_X004619 [Cordylochernes scorpioides]|uniref:Uncharacterized protein n=1 Tax=Cordylochernes scorpioides TaxID=51811 RepID=A0ABY6LXQ0_9ARAC|nr:hypothetical protein LAZ67_X004619 [Cordylochernes scorpioides]